MIILATSADIDLMREMRNSEYIKTIDWMKLNLSNERIIFIETVKSENPLIEEHYPVFYSNKHNPSYINQGANHGIALREFLNSNLFDDDELIVQTTGRYHFIDTYFFDILKENMGFDIYVLEREYQYFTGCFAMKYKYMKEWTNITDWDRLETGMINFEKSLYDYTKLKNIKEFRLDKVNMDCNIFAKGNLDKQIM